MKKEIRVICNVVLTSVLVVGLVCLGISQLNYRESRRDNEEAIQTTKDTVPMPSATQPVIEEPVDETMVIIPAEEERLGQEIKTQRPHLTPAQGCQSHRREPPDVP